MNQILIPTVAKFPKDIEKSWALAKSIVGYHSGLMLLIQNGMQGVFGGDAEVQKQNLQSFAEEYGDNLIVVMLSNIPIWDVDFFHNTDGALAHVKGGVDFAKSLGVGGKKVVTFHLNTLLNPGEFLKTSLNFKKIFDERIAPVLLEVSEYASKNGVELNVETVPNPEFGDLAVTDEREYLGTKLRDLRNPYLISWDASIVSFHKLRELGLGICLDMCHSQMLGVDLLEEVKNLLPTDLVHLNDGSGEFTEEGGCFKEGVTLGEGDISNLSEIIKELNKKNIPMVLEINETDFVNRPNTKTSIEFLLKI